MQLDWFFLAALAAVFNGLQGFAYKTAAEGKKNTIVLLFAQSAISCVVAGMVVTTTATKLDDFGALAGFGAIGAAGFVALAAIRLKALKLVPASYVFTIFRSNVILVLAISYFLPKPLNERISLLQFVGVVFILGAVWLFSSKHHEGRPRRLRTGILLSLIAVVISPVLYVSQKLAVGQFSIDTHLLILAIQPACFIGSRWSWHPHRFRSATTQINES